MKIEPLFGHHCYHCSGQPVCRISSVSRIEYRGMIFDVTKVFRECKMCGARWENTQDPDWREEVQQMYLKRVTHERRT